MDYVSGELPDAVRREFDHHLTLCPDCRHYLAAYRRAIELGRLAFDEQGASPEGAVVPETLVRAILAARNADHADHTDWGGPNRAIMDKPPQNTATRQRAEAEYREMPGLKLTPAQAARLWHLDVAASGALLESMVEAGLLHKTRDGAYLLLSARWPAGKRNIGHHDVVRFHFHDRAADGAGIGPRHQHAEVWARWPLMCVKAILPRCQIAG
jgi:hypothetical protein